MGTANANLDLISEYQESEKPFIRKVMPENGEMQVTVVKERRLEYRLGEPSKWVSNSLTNVAQATITDSGEIAGVRWYNQAGSLNFLPTAKSEIEALIKFLTRVLEETPR